MIMNTFIPIMCSVTALAGFLKFKYFYLSNIETSKRQLYEIECRNDQMISTQQQPKIHNNYSNSKIMTIKNKQMLRKLVLIGIFHPY